jgi:amino acid adenylation domain-containing protein
VSQGPDPETARGRGGLLDYLHAAVDRAPARLAVRERGRAATYREVDTMSRALASVLTQTGACAGTRTGLWLNKSIESIVSIYGILRSGGAYVPIDPTAPARRAAQVIADCGLSALITTPDRVNALLRVSDGKLNAGTVVLVGDVSDVPGPASTVMSWHEMMERPGQARSADVTSNPDDIAYILYTSGSTGAPKGVTLTHRNAETFVSWAAEEFGLCADDVLASHAPLHFDLSVLDIFGAAAAAACLALVPDSAQGNGFGLVRFVMDERISVWYSVPGALRRMVSAANGQLLPVSRLRVVAFAGEVYHIAHLKALWEVMPRSAVLYNLYGPTETNVCAYHRVTEDDISGGGRSTLPIGVPCPYAGAFLLTDDAALSANGDQSGELCVSGESVMAGYWNDGAATATRMMRPNGHREMYYRTGDIVRRDATGLYFFHGRRDEMVKVRGYRVELGEVEAVMSRHPAVTETACVAVDDIDEGTILVAFASLAPAAMADDAVLRRHCREFLPTYMVPQIIILVDQLARTATGKIDRKLLASTAAAGKNHRDR